MPQRGDGPGKPGRSKGSPGYADPPGEELERAGGGVVFDGGEVQNWPNGNIGNSNRKGSNSRCLA